MPAGFNMSLARSEDMVHQIEAVSQGDLAAVLTRNLVISQSLHAVDALLLTLHIWEVWNFELWSRQGWLRGFQCKIGSGKRNRTVLGYQ